MLPDLKTVPHHPALTEIVDVLCARTQNSDRSFFNAEVAYFLGKMASSMRVSINTMDRGEIPVNIYALGLASSGYGKGFSVFIMEQDFLGGFKERFMEETFPVIAEQGLWVIANNRAARSNTDQQEEFDKAKKEFDSFGPIMFSFDSGSPEGTKQMRQKLLRANVGAINLQIDEIGLNLVKEADLLTLFLELYDQGMVKQKLIKNSSDNKRGEEIDGKTPTNMLLFGTQSKLLDGSESEDKFYSFLDTGYARRCFFGMGQRNRTSKGLTPKELLSRITQPEHQAAMSKWHHKFYELADAAMYQWKMDMSEDVTLLLLAYQMQCEKLADELGDHDEIRKAEISHRHSKALKLAGAYAFVDQSTEIEEMHLLAAIKLAEESGEAFQTILNREQPYVKLAKFIVGMKNELTHADIKEHLPFYKGSASVRNDLMNLAIQWGYKRHMIIKKTFVDGIEFFKGETLKETNLEELVVAYSDHWAYHYRADVAPFDKLHLLTKAEGKHWANHHFKDGHRTEENVISGFNMVVIDVDGGVPLHTAHELLKDYKFMTYTTKSHTEESNRFRLILPINYHLTLDTDEYKEFMNGIMAWLPFETDETANQRAKKWESFAGGLVTYNLEGHLLDCLPFIPKTRRNEQYQQQNQELGSLDNLERWFAGRMGGVGTGRNNQMIKYALCLVDAGWDLNSVKQQVLAFDAKLQAPMGEDELSKTVLVTVAKKYQGNA